MTMVELREVSIQNARKRIHCGVLRVCVSVSSALGHNRL